MEFHPHIWHIEDGQSEWGEINGWYFSDETERFNGPYRSAIEAIVAFDHYLAYYL